MVVLFNDPIVVLGVISALEWVSVESGCTHCVFVPLLDRCRCLFVSFLLLDAVGQLFVLSADSGTLIQVILTSTSFESWGSSFVLEVFSVITHTDDGCASRSCELSISIATSFEIKQPYLENCQRTRH